MDELHEIEVYADNAEKVSLQCTCGWDMQAESMLPMRQLVGYANSHLTAASS